MPCKMTCDYLYLLPANTFRAHRSLPAELLEVLAACGGREGGREGSCGSPGAGGGGRTTTDGGHSAPHPYLTRPRLKVPAAAPVQLRVRPVEGERPKGRTRSPRVTGGVSL